MAAQKTAEADVAAAKATVRSGQINLGYASVTAPISGRIGRALVTEGALVGQGEATQLAVVQQINPMYVNFTQSTTDVLALRRAVESGKFRRAGNAANAASVRIVLEDGSAYAQPGKLLFSDLTVDPTSGQITLRAEVPNPNGFLLPGMYVRVRIEQAETPSGIVLPQQDAVVVLTSALPVAQLALDLVWEHLLPAFGDAPLPPAEDPLASSLGDALAALTLPTIAGAAISPTADRVAGIRFSFDDPKFSSVTLETGALTIARQGSEGRGTPLAFGHGEWVESADARVWASGAWVSPNSLVIRAHNIGTPFSRTYTLAFTTDAVTLDIIQNVAFGDLPHTHATSVSRG